MSLDERMRQAKVILQELGREPLRWGDLEKRAFSSRGSHWKFTALMRWLTDSCYILKDGPAGSRAPYRYNPEKVSFENGEVVIKIS